MSQESPTTPFGDVDPVFHGLKNNGSLDHTKFTLPIMKWHVLGNDHNQHEY